MQGIQLRQVVREVVQRRPLLLRLLVLLWLLLIWSYRRTSTTAVLDGATRRQQHIALPARRHLGQHLPVLVLLLPLPLLQVLRMLGEQLIDRRGGRRVWIEDVRFEAERVDKVGRDVGRERMQVGRKLDGLGQGDGGRLDEGHASGERVELGFGG